MAHQISILLSQLKVNFFPCKFQHINSIAAALFSIWKEIGKGLKAFKPCEHWKNCKYETKDCSPKMNGGTTGQDKQCSLICTHLMLW